MINILVLVLAGSSNGQMSFKVKTKCLELPSNSGNCTDSFYQHSHCPIENENGAVIDEVYCECTYKKFQNIALPDKCMWVKVQANETIFLQDPDTNHSNCTVDCHQVTAVDETVDENQTGIKNPFLNLPDKQSLEGMLHVKKSKFSGFLSSLYQTFLYGDELYDTQVVVDRDQLSDRERHWLEKRNQRYEDRQASKT